MIIITIKALTLPAPIFIEKAFSLFFFSLIRFIIFCWFTFFFFFKILRPTHILYYRVYIIICNAGAAIFQTLLKQFADAAFNVIDYFIFPFFIGKIAAQAFYILFQQFIRTFLNWYYRTLEIYINYFFHFDSVYSLLIIFIG